MPTPIDCFFAYPAKPPALSEVIEKSILKINEAGTELVIAHGWKELNISGKIIVTEICTAIDKCPLFVCDLTILNPNVLFELGYAIARNKRIWITLDTSYEESKQNYDRFPLLRNVGYSGYQNSEHLVSQFFSEHPYEDIANTIYSKIITASSSRQRQNSILYLKSRVETEASIQLSRLIDNSISAILDDPLENNSPTLSWYVEHAKNSVGAIVHLLDEKRDDRFNQNAKYSFISGMVYGFGNSLLMLAHAKYSTPIDYSDLLSVHERADECILIASKWLGTITEDISYQKKKVGEVVKHTEAKIALRNLHLGEEMAENEQFELQDYFIPTAAFEDALKVSQSMIYIGRKGSGKTANLYKIAESLGNDRRNHICLIKPVGYELDGIMRLLNMNLSKAEQGYMLESLWKFLIYTELAKSVYTSIQENLYRGWSDNHLEFMKYVNEHEDLIKPDFAARMENAIRKLLIMDTSDSLVKQEAKVSEVLHSGILSHLRESLGLLLEEKEKVCVLIDNLDKSWKRGSDIGQLSDFLFGLLSVSRIITEEFSKIGQKKRRVRLSLIVFLRSDIFSYIIREAGERDKLTYRRLAWTDLNLLQRIIEERFLESSNRVMLPEEVWNKYFVESINTIPTKDYLVQRIIPRPRDIIYLCKASLAHAVNHGHLKIEAEDIAQAENEYSQYAFNSLEAETSAQIEHLEELLYEFAGVNTIVTRQQIEEYCLKVNLNPTLVQKSIDLLCESTFLGLETEKGRFEFVFNEEKSEVVRTLARKVRELTGVERYQINIPFRSYLDIKDSHL